MNINEMVGMIFDKIDVFDNEEIVFSNKNIKVTMFHNQSCCEDVNIEDICGDINNLVGVPILMAEEVTEVGDTSWRDSQWTFYKFATIKGYVTIRWYGESNGYYSVDVSLSKENLNKEVIK